jgi:hypothetical protein
MAYGLLSCGMGLSPHCRRESVRSDKGDEQKSAILSGSEKSQNTNTVPVRGQHREFDL